MITFRLLGPVEAERDHAPVTIGGERQRAVLAVLLLNANRVVPIAQIIDGVWADRPPSRALNTVQVYVSALRRALDPDLIKTQGRGYRLRADLHTLDLLEFLSAAGEGRRLLETHHYAEAAERFHHALGLWRGPALGDLGDAPFAQTELVTLEESRLAAVEARIDADLAIGRDADLVAELRTLVGEHPLRERFRGLLAEALYRAGRQADALAVFRETRSVLAAELWADPSPALRALEQTILTHSMLERVQLSHRPYLLMHDGGGRQLIVVLDPARSPMRLGRRSTNEICLGWDAEVSRRHADLEHTDDGWTLVDDELSRNGSFVDGERVRGRRRLQDAQMIRLGGTILLFRTSGALPTATGVGSDITADARVRAAAELSPEERALLDALASGTDTEDHHNADRLDALRRRFDVVGLPLSERDEVMLRRARAIGALSTRRA